MLKKLPIGIQTFREIIEEGYVYIDKTAHARALAESGKYFLPVAPAPLRQEPVPGYLKELFEGSEALFRGLHIHEHWDWSRRHPVIRLDFSGGVLDQPRGAGRGASASCWRRIAERLGVACDCEANEHPRLLRRADRPRPPGDRRARRRSWSTNTTSRSSTTSPTSSGRRAARGPEEPLLDDEGQDAHIRLVFMTGVTKFSKVSLFSGSTSSTT
jgi:hypothetical protein